MSRRTSPPPEDLASLGDRLARALRRSRDLQPVPVGASEREAVHESETATLYRYGPPEGAPVLAVYSLVNRPYLLDLAPGRSVIESLRQSGLSVYLLDWGYPDPMHRFLTLDDYVDGGIAEAVEHIATTRAEETVHLLGVCQGGDLALCYAALYPDRIRSLVTLATPVDFHTPGDALHRLARRVDMETVVEATGNVPAPELNAVFASLRPFQLLLQRYLGLAEIGDDDEALTDFLRMERWMYDSPDQAGAAFLQFARDFYQRNGLIGGTVRIAGRGVDLGSITTPVYNAYAEADHLVPPAAARALGRHVRSRDYRERAMPGGHLGMFVGRRAHRELYPDLSRWLLGRG